MPEIPEMETYKILLNKSVKGKKIMQVAVKRHKTVNIPAIEFINKVRGRIIEEIDRRAKYLIFRLKDGNYLLAHMMLDGRLKLASDQEEVKAQVIFSLEDGHNLNFCDMRLGYLNYHTPDQLQQELIELGVEPLSEEFTWPLFQEILKGRRGAIKSMLMDQKIIAGIGNAYSNEILFAASLLPDRKIPRLTEQERSNLFEVIPRILRNAIAEGGYIETPFADWDNQSGGMLDKFKVYDREGEQCLVCGKIIKKKQIGGRNAFYCHVCQR